MNVQLVCLLSALCGGAASTIYTGAAGRTGILTCSSFLPGDVKYLCREQCEEGNVLIQTPQARAVSGRYSLAFTSDPSGEAHVQITFTNLNQSDAGMYRFGLGTSVLPYAYCDVEIRVAQAPLNITSGFILTYTAGETALYSCGGAAEGSRSFLCVNSCATQKDVLIDTTNRTAWAGRFGLVSTPGGWYVLIVHATVGDTGFYLCGYDASGSFLALVDGDELPAPAPATKQPDVCFLLTVGLFLVGVLLGGCAMLLYKWMRQRNLDQKPSEPQHAANINKEEAVYENDSFYQTINVATKDQDYTTINK